MADLWLKGPVTTAAYGWRLERSDGITIGITSHDTDVEIDGLLYRANPGMQPASILHSGGLDSDGLEIKGAIKCDSISDNDLSSGRWDGARLMIFLFDWTAPDLAKRILAYGLLGAISMDAQGFTVDVRGLKAELNNPIVPQTSPTCRAEFCGAECGLNPARFQSISQAQAITGNLLNVSGQSVADNDLAFGTLRWLDGANCNASHIILSNSGDNITLLNAPDYLFDSGTLVQLFQGCDKTIETCSTRFNNAHNFRGEPYLPGNDLLTRYPGAA